MSEKSKAWFAAETIKDCGTWTYPETVGLTVAECDAAVSAGLLLREETGFGPVYRGAA